MSEAASKRVEHQHNELVWHAWNATALHRSRRLPPLAKLLIRSKPARSQTWQEQMQVFKLITLAHGGRVH